MEAFDSSDDRVGRWVRLETLKDAIPLLLPVSSALGFGIVYAIPTLKALVANLASLLPASLVGFWVMAIIPGWFCLTLVCSALTAFRYTRAIVESPVKAVITGVCFTPVVCLMHCVVISLGASIIENLFGAHLIFY